MGKKENLSYIICFIDRLYILQVVGVVLPLLY